MAAPNLISTTSIIGKTNVEFIVAAGANVLVNDVDSSQVIRLNALYITNVVNADAYCTVTLNRGGTYYPFHYNIRVPTGTTFVPVAKDTGIYLEEGDSLRLSASSDGVLRYLVTYEVMS